jgi:opine dehydrogenase
MVVLTIVGGGNGGHVLAALAGANPAMEVRILTTRPEIWAGKSVTVERPGIGGGASVTGRIAAVSADAGALIPGSDLVVWCGPVVATGAVFARLAPHIRAAQQTRPPHAPVYVGALFGQGCIHLLARLHFGAETPFFCFQSIPWLCRTVVPGAKCSIVGRKEYTLVAVHRANFTWLRKTLQPCLGGPAMLPLADFAAIVLNPANQIIHPARYWGIFRTFSPERPLAADAVPWLYRDFDDASAEALEGLDAELQAIKHALLTAAPAVCCFLGVFCVWFLVVFVCCKVIFFGWFFGHGFPCRLCVC